MNASRRLPTASVITLTAAPVDIEAVLVDTLDYLKSKPQELDWQRVHPSQIASRLIQENQSKFIGKTVASWETKLSPRAKHRDTRTELEVPLDKAGAWWIRGKMDDGNEFYTLVWIVDSVLVQNDVGGPATMRCAKFLDQKTPEFTHDSQQTKKAIHPRVQGPSH